MGDEIFGGWMPSLLADQPQHLVTTPLKFVFYIDHLASKMLERSMHAQTRLFGGSTQLIANMLASS